METKNKSGFFPALIICITLLIVGAGLIAAVYYGDDTYIGNSSAIEVNATINSSGTRTFGDDVGTASGTSGVTSSSYTSASTNTTSAISSSSSTSTSVSSSEFTVVTFPIETSIKPGLKPTINTARPTTKPTIPTAKPTEAPVIVTDDVIYINELCASNTIGITDSDGDMCDWIELYNSGAETVSLSGYTLKTSRLSYRLPEIDLNADEYLLVFASGKNKVVGRECHTSFKLDADGDMLTLYNGDNAVDNVVFGESEDDTSFSRAGIASGVSYNGTAGFINTSLVTPSYANTAEGLEAYFNMIDKASSLVINEVMATNSEYLEQSKEFYDWIEIKNISSSSVKLSDFYLSDSSSKPTKWKMPAVTLKAGGIIVFLASGEESRSNSKYYHTNFKLNGTKEHIYLFDKSEKCVDKLDVSGVPYGGSYGRMSGKKGFFFFEKPTPALENKNGLRSLALTPISAVKEGVYNDCDGLSVALKGEGVIYYTLDGSEPNEYDKLYDSPISITKTTVIRAVSFASGKIKSKIYSGTFVINANHTLPIVSVVLEPDDLWSHDSGLLAIGDGEEKYPYKGANFYQGWEKKANVSLYEEDGSFSIDCGFGVSGAGSRGLPKKSFALKFKSKYGSDTLEYNVFDNLEISSFGALRLRAGEDYPYSIFRDELFTSLAGDGMPEVVVQSYKFCAMYLNGEFWGIYSIREKVDENFVSAHENISDLDTIDIIEDATKANYGSSSEMVALRKYVQNHDMKDNDCFKYVSDRVNIESMIDWAISEIYTGNRDVSNVRYIKAGVDGKWKVVYYDIDWGFYTKSNAFYIYTSSSQSSRFIIFRTLMKNDFFRDTFLARLGYHLKTTYAYETVSKRIDELSAIIDGDVVNEYGKWKKSSYNSWKKKVESVRTFASTRGADIIDEAVSLFNLSAEQKEYYFG